MVFSVAVIGSGVMGAGIAQVAATAGHVVKLYDIRPEAVNKAIEDVRKNLQRFVGKNRLSAEVAEAAASRVQPAARIQELAGVKLAIEAVVEDLAVKKRLFAELEQVVDEDCILATNTSSLSITAIASDLKRPARIAGMHFFNPAPLMELVEVISGLTTDPSSAELVAQTAASWGKTPVHVKSAPGFIVNRVARPFYGEALRLLSERAASPASIDAIMRDSGGFRMGPFELMDLIGNDVNFAVTNSVFEAFFGDPRFAPSLIQQELVHAGFLGRKSGRGFFEYGPNAIPPQPMNEPPASAPPSIMLNDGDRFAQALQQRLNSSAILLVPNVTKKDSDYSVTFGDTTLAITDGRTATQRAHQMNIPGLVLVDLALDYKKATRLAIAKAHQCSDLAYASAVGLFQAAGYSVTRMRDLPGLAVMRTLAMLINEASDAVNQGICSIDAVDAAMEKGVNYPLGPFAWADKIGAPTVHAVLANLAAYYGEDRYRMSPLIQELLWSARTFHSKL